MRSIVVKFSVAVFVLAGMACNTSKVKPGRKDAKPNIIFILADDLGYGDVGFNGGEKILTPNIDLLATEGIVFNQFYSGSTVCGPSRASLMTGMHTGHCSVRENPRWTASGNPVDLSASDITVAKELKDAGYVTGIIGKWGLAENEGEGLPLNQGFDHFYGFARHGKAHHYYPDTLYSGNKKIHIEGNVWQEKKGRHGQDLFTEDAIRFIEENKDTTFFLYLAYTVPHFELTVPEDSKEPYRKMNWPLRKMKAGHYLHDPNGHVTYAGMVSRMDKHIGQIMSLLKDSGIDENTLVIFTSDNGHEYDDLKNEFFNSNGVFKGKKRHLYEGGIRMPFAARWPDKISPGSKSDHIAAFWDFLPTACELAGIEPSAKVDGISFVPSLLSSGEQKKDDYLYWEFNEGGGPMQAIRKDNWKAFRYVGKDIELYNLVDDPGEENNLAVEYPEVVKEMERILAGARTEHPEFPLVKKKFLKK